MSDTYELDRIHNGKTYHVGTLSYNPFERIAALEGALRRIAKLPHKKEDWFDGKALDVDLLMLLNYNTGRVQGQYDAAKIAQEALNEKE